LSLEPPRIARPAKIRPPRPITAAAILITVPLDAPEIGIWRSSSPSFDAASVARTGTSFGGAAVEAATTAAGALVGFSGEVSSVTALGRLGLGLSTGSTGESIAGAGAGVPSMSTSIESRPSTSAALSMTRSGRTDCAAGD